MSKPNIHNFYKKKYSLIKRKEISSFILKNNKDIYPIIIQPNDLELNWKEYFAFKFTGTMDLTCLIKIINNKENFKKDNSLYFIVYKKEKTIVNSKELIKNLYQNYKDEDGFLYIYYCKTDSFGINLNINF